jgi:hypothetical protein
MLASIDTLKCENPEGWQALYEDHARRFRPRDNFEIRLLQNMTHAMWAMRRGWASETATLDELIDALPHSQPFPKRMGEAFVNADCTEKFRRYERHLDLLYKRNLERLLKLREQVPLEEPVTDENKNVRKEPSPNSGHPNPQSKTAPAALKSASLTPNAESRTAKGGTPTPNPKPPTPFPAPICNLSPGQEYCISY